MPPALLPSGAVLLLASSLWGAGVLAQPVGTLTYKPTDDERPVVKTASLRPSGSNYALRLEFDRAPWGPSCKNRCANATFYIDTDDDKTTGLQAGEDKPQTGADLSVTVQGVQEFGEVSGGSRLRAKIRLLDAAARRLEDGDLVAELDHRTDRDRLEAEGTEVNVLIDASMGTLPSGKRCRFVYVPSGAKPVFAKCKGLGDQGGSNVRIEKRPRSSARPAQRDR